MGELRQELASPDVDLMKDAVKKVRFRSERGLFTTLVRTLSDCSKQHHTTLQVIAAVTVGKDMNALFPDVVNCMRTGAFVSGRIHDVLFGAHSRQSANSSTTG